MPSSLYAINGVVAYDRRCSSCSALIFQTIGLVVPEMPTFQNEKKDRIFCEARRAETRGPTGRKLSPEGPKRGGVIGQGGGGEPPPNQLECLGERCKLPSGVRVEPRPPNGFCDILSVQVTSPAILLAQVVKSGNMYIPSGKAGS